MTSGVRGAAAALLVAAALGVSAARAADQAGQADQADQPAAEHQIRKTVDDAFAVLKDKSLAGRERRPQRIAALRRIADASFDWSEMARGSLGVEWRSLDTRQRARFIEVFKDVLAAQYMDDIDRFQGTEKVTFDGSERQGEDVAVHTTLLTSSRDRVAIDYRLRLEQGRWMVVDLSVEGVSLVNHFRKTFANALTNMTVDQLIERLRRQLPPSDLPAGDHGEPRSSSSSSGAKRKESR
jgi:phospholipid transport system substrate-binding protein